MKKVLLLLNLVLISGILFAQKAQIDLPITWDDTANVNYGVIDFDGTSSMVTVDPVNASNLVLKTDKSPTGQLWQGTTFGDTLGFATAIPFSQGSNTISAVIYSPDSGIAVRLKAEDASDPTISVETETMTTVSNAWDTLVFDFSNHVSGTAAINYANTYNKLSIFYDFFNNPSATKSYYVDDVFFGGTVPPPPTYNVTFRVNMDTVTAGYTTPEVNGTFNGWCGACNAMTDANNDSIWEITVQLPAGSYEYKYSADAWGIQENLTPGSSCTVTNGGFTNRSLTVSGDTTLPVVCWASCFDCGFTPSYNVTFRVNMDTVTAAYTTPEVNGTFNGWCGACNAMTDANNDSIWEVTVQLQPGTYEYKFSADAWGIQENLTPGSSCTVTNGGFTNREFTFTGDTVLPVVCWASCMDCGSVAPPSKSQIDLPISWDDSANVDYALFDFDGTTSMIAADPMNSSNHVVQTVKDTAGQPWQGTILGNNGLANPIPFATGATTISAIVYSPDAGIPVRMKVEDNTDPTISVETETMTSVANAWDTLVFDFANEASGTAALNLTNTYDKVIIFYDFMTVPTATKTYYVDDVFFGGTSTPPPAADTVEITFNVNMALATPDSSGVYLAGGASFGVPGDNQMLDPDGDGTYSITVKRLKGFSGHYTFTNGACTDWSCKENIAGQSCADPGNFNDRFLPAVMNDTVISTCFGFCTTDGTCPMPPDSADVTFKLDMREFTGSFTQPYVTGALGISDWGCGTCNPMDDSDGDGIWETTLRLAKNTYEYKFTYDNWSGEETFDPTTGDSACTITTGQFTNRQIEVTGDMTTTTFCWESCDVCTDVSLETLNDEGNVKITLTGPSTLRVSGLETNDAAITVVNALGQEIAFEKTMNGADQIINIQKTNPGIYIVRVLDGELVKTAKLFIY